MDSKEKKEVPQTKQTQEQRTEHHNQGKNQSRRQHTNKPSHAPRGKRTVEPKVNADTLDKSIEEVIEPKKESIVKRIDHSIISINEDKYEIIKDYREAFDADQLNERYSPILEKYDYIVADWGYEQLRLKGFYANNNRKVSPDKKISHLEDYLFEYCNFGAPYFVLERLESNKKQPPVANENPRKKRKRKSRPNRRKNPYSENTQGPAPQPKADNITPAQPKVDKVTPTQPKVDKVTLTQPKADKITPVQNKKRPFVQKEVAPKVKEKIKETVVVKTVKDEKGSRRFNIRRNDVDRVKNKS